MILFIILAKVFSHKFHDQSQLVLFFSQKTPLFISILLGLIFKLSSIIMFPAFNSDNKISLFLSKIKSQPIFSKNFAILAAFSIFSLFSLSIFSSTSFNSSSLAFSLSSISLSIHSNSSSNSVNSTCSSLLNFSHSFSFNSLILLSISSLLSNNATLSSLKSLSIFSFFSSIH